MKVRRWSVGQATSVSGVPFRVVVGMKEPGDLRLEWRTSSGFRPIDMAAAALMVDFFVENEDHLRQYRPHWQRTASEEFFLFLKDAIDRGWEAANETLQSQRKRLGATPPKDALTTNGCRVLSPDGTETCTGNMGHDGPHKGATWVWPRQDAA